MPIKCPKCKGCSVYQTIDNKTYIACDFCQKYYWIKPGGDYEVSDRSWDTEGNQSVRKNVPNV